MPYVKRTGGVITALYARPQPGTAEDYLPEDHPDVVEYRTPRPPTDAERIDAAFHGSDTARVIFEALFELANDVRGLKGQPAINRGQLRDWLKTKLP